MATGWGGWEVIGCTLTAVGPGPGGTRDPSDEDRELWDISGPCTALSSGTRGEVERAKTVEVTKGRETGGTEERRVDGVGCGERAEGRVDVVRREDPRAADWRVEGRVDVAVEGMRC